MFRARKETPSGVLQAVARLMAFFAPGSSGNPPDGLTVLVGLGAPLVEGRVSPPDPGMLGALGFADGGAELFIQISAQSDVHRLFALRVVGELLADLYKERSEILGARLLTGQEPFGFQDGLDGGYQKSVAQALPGAGSWLLYQRFVQDVAGFAAAKTTPTARAKVMGRAPMGDAATRAAVETALSQAAERGEQPGHAQLMKALAPKPTLVRRGFSYRHSSAEGLAFVGVAPDFSTFGTVLGAMKGGNDPLLAFVSPVDGGVFFCPPDAEWLGVGSVAPFVPKTVDALANAGHLISYDTTTAFLDFLMLLKKNGLFDDQDRPTRISDAARPHMDALYAALAPAHVTNAAAEGRSLTVAQAIAEMQTAEQTAFSNAAAVNADYDEYITYG